MNWLRIKIVNWIAPLFMPALDECNKRNLEQYYRNQREFINQTTVFQDRVTEWMNSNKDARAQHAEYMERFDRLISAIEGLKK